MSAAHPAGRDLVCDVPRCGQPARTAVAIWPGTAQVPGTAMVRPLTPGAPGNRFCMDCAHLAVDQMLLRATPYPTGAPE